MRRLLPPHLALGGEVQAVEAYDTKDRPSPDGRPWVLLDMIASADGATHAGGVTAELGGPADKAVFAVLRGVADVILVGAATVRAERYGPPRPSEATRQRRRERGQAEVPTLAVVSASLELEWDSPLFTESPIRPLVITAAGVDPERLERAGEVADVLLAGAGRSVDLGAALRELRQRGAAVVTCEGGPRLNGQLVDAGLVDEVCLTLSPTLLGGDSARIAAGTGDGALRRMRLVHLLEQDGLVFLRWVRR
jgi:riboflavin biosynthesis pyrimidine reductase